MNLNCILGGFSYFIFLDSPGVIHSMLAVRFWPTAFYLGKLGDLVAVLAINVKGFLCRNLVSLTRKSLTTWVDFPGGTNGKEAICQSRRCKRLKFYPSVGKIP